MVAVYSFLTQFHGFLCQLNTLFKDKLAYSLTFVFFITQQVYLIHCFIIIKHEFAFLYVLPHSIYQE